MTLRLQGKPGQRSAWILPSGLEKLASLLHPGVPPAGALLLEHTLFPLFQPFLPSETASALRSHFLGTSVPGIAAACGLLPYGVSSRWNRSVCISCLAEDSESGQLHWRTSHLIPGIAMCSIHLEPLYTYCETCASGFRQSMGVSLPSIRCACGGDLVRVRLLGTPEERRAEAEIACMAGQILTNHSFSDLTYDQILATISNRAKEFGYGGPGGLVRTRVMLEKRIGQETLDAHHIRTGTATVFRQAFAGCQLPRNPIQNIVLIYGLFGSLENFINAAHSSSLSTWDSSLYRDSTGKVVRRRLGRPHSYAKWDRMTNEELAPVRANARRQALEAKQANPCLTRTEFSRASSASTVSYKFLLRFDKVWLDEIFPAKPFTSRNSSRFDENRVQRDHSLAAHVYTRRTLLVKSALPARITMRRLLQGHTLESVGRKRLKGFCATQKALIACVESSQDWSIRRTSLLLNFAFSLSPDAPFDKHLELSTLNQGQLKYLQRKINKWCEERVST